jgi:hypothetical protein
MSKRKETAIKECTSKTSNGGGIVFRPARDFSVKTKAIYVKKGVPIVWVD